jgi:hypothetical protein
MSVSSQWQITSATFSAGCGAERLADGVSAWRWSAERSGFETCRQTWLSVSSGDIGSQEHIKHLEEKLMVKFGFD